MPQLDMPLEELRQYSGTNPIPADFDKYWEDALLEMRSVDPRVTIEPADFQAPSADCFHYRWTGVGGARLHAKHLRPKNPGKDSPALLFFHGYSGSSGTWMDHLAWAASGYHVWAMDCRGQGGESEDNTVVTGNTHKGHIIRGLTDSPAKLYYRQVFLDTAQLAGLVMEHDGVAADRVAAKGDSQGGGLTLACAALEPRISCLAPLHPFLSDYKRVWDIDLAKTAYEEIVYWFRRFDPLHEREEEIFETLGYIDVQNLVRRIKGKVLMGVGLDDNVCPPSSQFAAYNKIESEKELLIYPDFAHEVPPGHEDRVFLFIDGHIGKS